MAPCGPRIQFLILTLFSQRGISQTSRLLLQTYLPPPSLPSGPVTTPGATKVLIGHLIYPLIYEYL